MKNEKELLDELSSSKCQCGKKKSPRNTFCPNCYYRLPLDMRKNIYKDIWHGYAECYMEAVEYLNK
jgi:hypothetical protein